MNPTPTIARPTGNVRYVAGPYAAYTVEMDPWDYHAIDSADLGYPPLLGLNATLPSNSHRPVAAILEDSRVSLHVPEEENIRRAILLTRYFALVVGDAVHLPHVQGQAVYGEDTPEVRARVLPDCERVVYALAEGDNWGAMSAIQREDGHVHGGTAREVNQHNMACSSGQDAVCRTWPEWAAILRAAGVDPNEEVETVWSLRRRLVETIASKKKWQRKWLELNRQRPELPPRVAASDALAAMSKVLADPDLDPRQVEWRQGIPPVEVVDAHEQRSGQWAASLRPRLGGAPTGIEVISLIVERKDGAEPRVVQLLNRQPPQAVWQWRPISGDGIPEQWPDTALEAR